jgi:hypothetical protein
MSLQLIGVILWHPFHPCSKIAKPSDFFHGPASFALSSLYSSVAVPIVQGSIRWTLRIRIPWAGQPD